MELGPRDIEANTTLAVRRYDSKKWSIPLGDISSAIRQTLDEIQTEMYTRAKNVQDERLKLVTKWEDVVPTLDAKNILVLPWCEEESCEDDIKERSKSQYVLALLIPSLSRILSLRHSLPCYASHPEPDRHLRRGRKP